MPYNAFVVVLAMAVTVGIAYAAGSNLLVAGVSGAVGGLIGVAFGDR